jgi:hypothetical protein
MSGDISLAEAYLNMYSEKADIEKEEILKWMPIVAAGRLAKSSEQEREFLLSWINK